MIDERMWQIMQKRLGYSDDEIALFRKDPRNEQVLEKAKELGVETLDEEEFLKLIGR